MNSGSNTAGEQAAAIAFTRKSLLGAGLATAASFVAAPGGLAGTNRDTATAKRLAKLRKAREQLVIEHGRTENDGQLDKTMRTFSRAHEELIPLGSVIDGEKAVKDYYDGSWTVFPGPAQRQRLDPPPRRLRGHRRGERVALRGAVYCPSLWSASR